MGRLERRRQLHDGRAKEVELLRDLAPELDRLLRQVLGALGLSLPVGTRQLAEGVEKHEGFVLGYGVEERPVRVQVSVSCERPVELSLRRRERGVRERGVGDLLRSALAGALEGGAEAGGAAAHAVEPPWNPAEPGRSQLSMEMGGRVGDPAPI